MSTILHFTNQPIDDAYLEFEDWDQEPYSEYVDDWQDEKARNLIARRWQQAKAKTVQEEPGVQRPNRSW